MTQNEAVEASDEEAMLSAEADELRQALLGCVALIEGWAYGPIARAGIGWPGGVCRAPALREAKRLLGLDPDRRLALEAANR